MGSELVVPGGGGGRAAGRLWGSALGVLGGLLVPKGKGRGLVFGLLWAGVVAGVAAGTAGLVGLLSGQPYAVWCPLVLCGFLLTSLSVPSCSLCGTATGRWSCGRCRRRR